MEQCSIIAISNNRNQYDLFVESLKTQKNIEYQLITIENYNNEYIGARQAFNENISAAKYDTIIFCHPDISFLNEYALEKIVKAVSQLKNLGVAGSAGCKNGRRWEILSTMYHGKDKEHCGTSIKEATVVQCVDECFFIMKKSLVNSLKFTELNGWHLYAVEQCVRANLMNKQNYVIPVDMWHFSDGKSLDPQYLKTLLKLKEKYLVNEGILNTTVKQWDLKSFRGYLYIQYYYYKQLIKKVMKRLKILKVG